MYRNRYNVSGGCGGSHTHRANDSWGGRGGASYGGLYGGYGGGYRPRRHYRRTYGPMLNSRFPGLFGRGPVRRRRRDRPFRYWFSPEELSREEHRENDRLREEEDMRIPEEEARKARTLTVSHLDLHVGENTHAHRTNEYHCVASADPPQLVLRRGQEFTLTLTFDRRYDKGQDDLEFIFSPDDGDDSSDDRERRAGDNPLDVVFRLDEEKAENDAFSPVQQGWGARILGGSPDPKGMRVSVHVPGNCVVGEWDLTVRTRLQGDDDAEDFEYDVPQSVIILFNPWSRGDQVFFTEDQNLLEEYVMNDEGMVFKGGRGDPWSYGQFQENILNICLLLLRKAFKFTVTEAMGDAVRVSRALSKIVNSQDDNGLLVGNWSGNYRGGEHPSSWKSSAAILRRFYNSRRSVKYGQCWVFSHALTAVCRALGLPCRSVTNFSSAHDTNNSCTIDKYYDVEGEFMEGATRDSIWNFHVWNEMWILRPDLGKKGDYDGWHVIDATPQEMSGGVMQCGPCPIKAILRGEVEVGYDTRFVFSEVNADVIHWKAKPGGGFEVIDIKTTMVGESITTMNPDTERAMDITSLYKYPEGAGRERAAVHNAVGDDLGRILYNKDLEVSFKRDTVVAAVGKDLELTLMVKNTSREDKRVKVSMTARATRYWNNSDNTRLLAKRREPRDNIGAGRTQSYKLPVTFHQYMAACDDMWTISGFAFVEDVTDNRSYTAENNFRLETPPLGVQGPQRARPGQPVTVTVTFTNPLPIPLSNCSFSMDGGLDVAPDDTHPWSRQDGTLRMTFRRDSAVRASERATLTVRLVGKWAAAERKLTKAMTISFDCDELGSMHGRYRLTRMA